MDQQQFEERMEEALADPFPENHWPPTRFRERLGSALRFTSPHMLGIKAPVYRKLVSFAVNESTSLSLTEAAAALNCMEAAKPSEMDLDTYDASRTYIEAAEAAKAWNEIVEPIKKKAFAEIAAQAKLQQTAPKGKVIKLAAGKKAK